MRLIPITLLLLLYFGAANAQPLDDNPHTLLWAVINAKGDTSYLFGTFHEFGQTYFKQYPIVAQKYKEASSIAIEALQTSLSDAPRQAKPKNWVKHLSKADYKLINDYCQKLEFDYELKKYKHVPPSYIRQAILSELYLRQCRIWTEKDIWPMEEYLTNYAKKYNKRLIGLESMLDTNRKMLFNNESDADDIKAIKDIALNEKAYSDTLGKLCLEADNYRNVDVNYKFSVTATTDDPSFQYLLDNRNRNWLPTIKQSVDTQKTFIAVGMKHLWYKNGLINLLLKEGYNVVPIAMK